MPPCCSPSGSEVEPIYLSGQAGSETVRTLSELYTKVPNFEHLVQGADGMRLRYVDLIRYGEEDGKR